MQSRIFYVLTLKSNRKKKELLRFLEREWLPALRDAPGCVEVEILDTYHDRAGYCISELWESKEIHLQSTAKLWREEKRDLTQKLADYATIESLWNCAIVN